MIQGEPINPAGISRNDPPARDTFPGKITGPLQKGRRLFHAAPSAMHGDSGEVMDHYMKYHKKQSGMQH